jgi:uncharacterized protein (UPF0335 family)
MNAREIARLKASVADLVGSIQALRRRNAEIDQKLAELYRAARHQGIAVKAAKEVVRELHGESASVDAIWSRYAAEAGIDEAEIFADDPLEKILGPA